jgi:DNA polymerase-3 subunit beta
MKFTVNRVSFLKQLNTVNVAIGPKSPTPAFLNFKLEMNDDGLTVLGSDNEITIKNFLPVSKDDKTFIENYTEGSTLISAKYLLEIVRRLDGEKVTIEVIDDVIVQISDNKAHFQLNSMRSEEYPDLDLAVSGEKVVLSDAEFKKIVSQTTFAASTRDVRPILTAVNFKAGSGLAEFVATDSYRLSKKTSNISNSNTFEVNIPVKALNEVSKLLENDQITLHIAGNKVVFEFGGTMFYSRLINGDFPKTSRMIPSNYPYVLKVNANAFVNAMQRVSLLAVERERIVKLSLDEAGVEISSKSEQIGSANEKVELFEYEGGRLDISFNVDYVTDAIKAAQSEDVILSFAGEMNAFRVTSPEDESIIQIVTPVRSYY